MHSVQEALRSILDHAAPLPARPAPLHDALGLFLAEDVQSDIDSPPHDKSMVDGYALRRVDLQAGQPTTLQIIEEVTAGRVPTKPVAADETVRIMTGAPIPEGADAVVMVEESTVARDDPTRVHIAASPRLPESGNIMPQGASMRAGDAVLATGHRIGAIEIGLLAEVGRPDVLTIEGPRVAVIATGDELVDVAQKPAAGMIRNSNGPMLDALVREVGATPVGAVIARDDIESLTSAIQTGLEADVLLLSGGVSAGVLDLAPQVLQQCGVRQQFHKVRVKPGKPLWFGWKQLWKQLDTQPASKTLVFGLPGNPVSSLVGFLLFAAPAIRKLAGQASPFEGDEFDAFLDFHQFGAAELSEPFTHHGGRPTFHPAAITHREPHHVAPLNWRGSADLRTLAQANSLICFPPGEASYRPGDSVRVMRIANR